MATKEIGQVATLRIPLMAVAPGGFSLYTKDVGEAGSPPGDYRNTEELSC